MLLLNTYTERQNNMSQDQFCPKCQSQEYVKSGIIKGRQRFKCKNCNYYFTVQKLGKRIDNYYVVKALQLYVEGVSFREIERILGVSHVSVMNWVKTYKIKRPQLQYNHKPSFEVLEHEQLLERMKSPEYLEQKGLLISEVEGKFFVLNWNQNH